MQNLIALNAKYDEAKLLWEANLKEYGVKLPARSTQGGIVLAYLFLNIDTEISKEKLTAVLTYNNKPTNDVQAGRHLGNKHGFYVLSGTNNDINPTTGNPIAPRHYLLHTLTSPSPSWNGSRISQKVINWTKIKAKYNNSCASCGAKEGATHPKNKTSVVLLEKGHIDPNKKLTNANIIPQCRQCNGPYRDKFIFDSSGKIAKVNVKSSAFLSIIPSKHMATAAAKIGTALSDRQLRKLISELSKVANGRADAKRT